jgi:hypothetical protein
MYVIKSISLALVTILMIGAVTASATTIHPLFLTQSGGTLKFTSSSGLTRLRFLGSVGNEYRIECEKSVGSGEILNKSTLERKVEWEFSGKCVVNGSSCEEPIKTKLAFGELGLLNSATKKVVLLLAPESGTVFLVSACTAKFPVEGAIVAEVPEINRTGERQYNVDRKNFELQYATVNEKHQQKITEILLLGTQMLGSELILNLGFFPQEFSIETLETLAPDGNVLIDTQ